MKLVLKGLIGLWVVVMVVGLILPKEYEISRSIEIDATPAQIHQYTQDLEQWVHWQPWIDVDPSVQVTLGEISQGQGASQRWTSDSGDGSLHFTQVDGQTGIEYDISFNNGANLAKASLSYHPIDANVTKLTWQMRGQIDTPIFGAYLALFMDGMVGESFDLGLFKLKKLVETGIPM